MFHLIPHAANASEAISAIAVHVRRCGDMVSLRHRCYGRLAEVVWPTAAAPDRQDGLWRHSCFEAFVARPGNPAYVELNMAPSGAWAASRFGDYRDGMAAAAAAPQRDFGWWKGEAVLTAHWRLPDLARAADWQLGLSAVIETRDGARSYFALAHAAGPPDFHKRDCFIASLPAPSGA
ncbi:MAG: hypothetical protein C0476_01975 [Sphingomonas sp.]|nr:hypothetical protein [Sphingomonas sp.]